MIARTYPIAVLVAVDRLGDAIITGDPDLTISQQVGLGVLRAETWALDFDPLLSLLMGEAHHAVRSLYDDLGAPIFPDRMPKGAPAANPYP